MPNEPYDPRLPVYFYFHGDLHRRVHINRPADQVRTYSYAEERYITYSFSDVRKNHERAFSTREAAAMLMRSRLRLEEAILSGNIPPPKKSHKLGGNPKMKAYRWNENDIMNAHAHFSMTHRGRPRKDGQITPQKLPTAKELRAIIRQNLIMYVKNKDGEFVPTWDA